MVFRSAFNYLSQAGTQLLGQTSDQHPLIGENIEIGGNQYIVRSLLAEGGFALVFSVQHSKTGEWFALKRQLAVDRIAADAITNEINFSKQLSGHRSIVQFCRATQIDPKKQSGQQYYAEFLMLTELCSGGTLIDYMRKMDLSNQQICKIFHAVSSAVQHMHDRNPPITHRDIKIENLLFDSQGFIKLCDFGSATTDIYRPDEDWSALMRSELEEEMAKFTTPMYRAPEILETYQNYPIGPAQDVWALGCVLFYLCYKVHPFEDSAKLRIINARYNLPDNSPFQIFHNLIQQTLQPDPYSRPSIQDLYEQIEEVAMALNVDLDEPIIPMEQLDSIIKIDCSPSSSMGNQSARMFLDQGMNLIRTIKEKSPVINISEQLKSQLGYEMNQSGSESSSEQKKSAPPRPPPPPSFQTQITQLTHKEPSNLHPKLKPTNVRNTDKLIEQSNDVKMQEKKAQNTMTTNFFETLNWNLIENSNNHQQKQQSSSIMNATVAPIGINDLDFVGEEFKEFEIGNKNYDMKTDEFIGKQNCQENVEHMNKAGSSNDVDLLKLLEEELPTEEAKMHRNKSAPNFISQNEDGVQQKNKTAEDIFAEFLTERGGQNLNKQSQEKYRQPDYSRKNFEPTQDKEEKPKTRNNAFDDLLIEQGFTSSTKQSNRTLTDLVKERDAQEMDPIALKIKYWTDGKQRNIRALLGSLSDILWEEAKASWTQPSVAELFEGEKIKKHYRRACLVVHPDKQSGTANEPLAKAIFTELNDAWNEFVKN